MTKKYCDLHTHSNFSDGTLSPKELIALAESVGLSALTLSDHSTVSGLYEFTSAARGSSVTADPGIEFTTDYGGVELHIVAHFVNEQYYSTIEELLSDLIKKKEESNVLLARNLKLAGYDVLYSEMQKSKSGQINRAHFAARLVELGYVGSIPEAFDKLLSPTRGYYVPPKRLSSFEAIAFIREIGAVPTLAHPFLNLSETNLREFLKKAIGFGLLSMETLYSEYDEKTMETARAMAKEFSLLESGGSDFHGDRKPHIALGRGRGDLFVPIEFFEALRERAQDK